MSAPQRLGGLDALRGIAALLVVGLHTQAVFHHPHSWFSRGYLAVDFFLMLSGYLMARITEKRLGMGLTPRRFLIARYRRFWPMMALGMAIGVPFAWARADGWAQFLPLFAANMLLLPFPFDRVLFALNIPAWTIFFELLANAAHVLVLHRIGRRSLSLLAAALFVATAWIAWSWGSLDLGARPSNFWPAVPRVLLAYTLGILLWRWLGERPVRMLPAWLAFAAMPMAVLGAHALGWKTWQFDLFFVVVLCPAVVLSAATISGQTRIGWLSAAISFPLFAIHLPILEAMRELGFGWHAALAAALTAALTVTLWTNRPARRMAGATPMGG